MPRPGADVVTAQTMTHTGEAIGIARAAARAGIPCVVSFTVETDGRLPGWLAVARWPRWRWTPRPTRAPSLYMVNCAHPTHIAPALEVGGDWLRRMGGVRANPSPKSHAELNELTSLEDGDPVALGEQLGAIRRSFPHFCLFGGCCGSDFRHAERIWVLSAGRVSTTGAAPVRLGPCGVSCPARQDIAPGARSDTGGACARYRIPLGTLRDWEQSRSEPAHLATARQHGLRLA